jgi:sugar phosphate isomerase/epimerase
MGMQQVLSTHLFVRHRLTTVWLERIWDAGFPAVDITEPVKAKRMNCVDEIKRALEIAEVVPFRYLIQHVGVSGEEMNERRFDSAFSSIDEIRVFAAQRGVEVLLENIPNAFSTAARLNDFLAQTHLDLKYCFDIGHAHMSNGVEAEFELMKDRIRSTHLHDNDGQEDLHLFPRKGTIDWTRAIRLLTSRPEQYPLLLELKELPDQEHPIRDARTAMDEVMELADKRGE